MFKTKILLLIIPVVLLISCAGGKKFPPVKPVKQEDFEERIAKERAAANFIRARDYERRHLYDMALKCYENAFELEPTSDVLKDLLINAYIRAGRYEKALITLKRGILPIDSLDDKEKRLAAVLYGELKQYDKAASVTERFSIITGKDRCRLGALYEKGKNLKKSIENYLLCFEKEKSFETGMKIASLYLIDKKYEKADSFYTRLDSLYPEQKTDILNALGVSHILQGDTLSALDLFKTVLLLDSSNQQSLENVASVLINRRDYKGAISYYEKIKESDFLKDKYRKRALALLYYNANMYEKAENVFTELLSDDINNYEYHFYLGLVLREQKKYDLAEKELKQALTIKSRFADAWIHLCYLYIDKKDKEKALECAKNFNTILPENGSSWRILGFVQNSMRLFKEAAESLLKAEAYYPADPALLFELGMALERSGKKSEAELKFGKVLEINPDDHAAANYLGYMWAEQGKNLDSAQQLLEMALGKSPDNGAYLDSYGWILFMKGQYEGAKEYIQKAISKIDSDPIVYEHLGDILVKLNEIEGAKDAYNKSLELDSPNASTIREKIKKLEIEND